MTFASLTLGGSARPTLKVSAPVDTAGSVTIHSGATLQHDTTQRVSFGRLTALRGALITHSPNGTTRAFVVNLNLAGDFELQAGATVAVDGRGYAGGAAGIPFTSVPGAGPGGGGGTPQIFQGGGGGGHAGRGGSGQNVANGGGAYGDPTSPADLGSGGGAGSLWFCNNGAGGAGGGAVLISASGLMKIDGLVTANGADGLPNGGSSPCRDRNDGSGGGGSGGTIRLTAASLSGSGVLQANGGAGGVSPGIRISAAGGGGGGGRIAVSASVADGSSLTIRADRGQGGPLAVGGGAGVIARKAPGAARFGLVIGSLTAVPQSTTPVAGASLTFDAVTLNHSIVAFDAGSAVAMAALSVPGNVDVRAHDLTVASGLDVTGTAALAASGLSIGTGIEVRSGGRLRLDAVSTSGALLVRGGGVFEQRNTRQLSFSSIDVEPGGSLTHSPNGATRAAILNLSAAGDLRLQVGAMVALDGMGYAGGPNGISFTSVPGSGPGGGGGTPQQFQGGGGGGHGGRGGAGQNTNNGGAGYGDVTNPVEVGSGGGAGRLNFCNNGAGGAGGGAAVLAAGGLMTIDGTISANGADGGSNSAGNPCGNSNDGSGGGGAGGSINLKAPTLAGSGSLRANGGRGGTPSGPLTGRVAAGGGGGGGRIAIEVSGSDSSALALEAKAAVAGSGGAGGIAFNGGAGVIALKKPGRTVHDLLIGDLATVPQSTTPVAGASLAFGSVDVRRAIVAFDAGGLLEADTLALEGDVDLVASRVALASGLDVRGTALVKIENGAFLPDADIVSGGRLRLDANAVSGALKVRDGGVFEQMNARPLAFSSVDVEPGGVLTHGANAASRDFVLNLSVVGDLNLPAGAVINVDGKGYAGGAAGTSFTAVPGFGPGGGGGTPLDFQGGGGGGHAGTGGGGENIAGNGGRAYDAFTAPIDLGSGGGAGRLNFCNNGAGGAGGGAVLLQAGGTLRLDGTVSANGANGLSNSAGGVCTNSRDGSGGGGGGGTISLTAPTITGAATLRANGGAGGTPHNDTGGNVASGGGGGGGRIALAATATDSSSFLLEANAGPGGTSALSGGAGIIAVKRPGVAKHTLTVGDAATAAQSTTPISGAPFDFEEIAVNSAIASVDSGVLKVARMTISPVGTLMIHSPLEAGELRVRGAVTHSAGSGGFDLAVGGELIVEPGARITADGAGYAAGQGPGAGYNALGSEGGGGGGYGGLGGGSLASRPASGQTYGSFVQPLELGSGGGTGAGGLRGGRGAGKLNIRAGTLRLDGRISSNGADGPGGGGSGGAVLVTVSRLEGSGTISANGGSSTSGGSRGGGGGGGRVALFYGTRTGAVTAEAKGGAGFAAGKPGTVLDNGQLAGFDAGASTGTVAFSQLQQSLESSDRLTETLSSQLLDFAGGVSTGAPGGTFTTADVRLALVETGAYAGKGFFRGRWALALSPTHTLTGEWEGMAFKAKEAGRVLLKGVLKGQIRGVLDGSLLETAPGSGVFNRLAANCRVVQVDAAAGAGDLYISAAGVQRQSAQHPGTPLKLLQTSQVGSLSGYYSDPIDVTFTYLGVDSPGHPFQGEGFFLASYASALGSGSGWAYAAAHDHVARLAGILEQPLRGLMEGALVLAAPRALAMALQNLDAGLAFKPEIVINMVSADQAIPGGSGSFSIELRNDGYGSAENVSLIAVGPIVANFVAASGDYRHYNVAHWEADVYHPKPFVRWDLAQIPARTVRTFHYDVRYRIGAGTPASGTNVAGDAYLVDKAWADKIFAIYEE